MLRLSVAGDCSKKGPSECWGPRLENSSGAFQEDCTICLQRDYMGKLVSIDDSDHFNSMVRIGKAVARAQLAESRCF